MRANLYQMLVGANVSQQFSVYITNDYDQNLLIGRGTRGEMLNENETGGCVFDHLFDNVTVWQAKGDRVIIFIENEDCSKPVEEQFDNSEEWGEAPEERPWRYSIETELYTDKYIRMVWA